MMVYPRDYVVRESSLDAQTTGLVARQVVVSVSNSWVNKVLEPL